MNSIRVRLSVALIILVALVSSLAATVTYRRVLAETSTLFDYQLRQMALSLRGQISLAPRIEIPPDQGESDFVVQIWDIFGTRVYLSRPGLPMINQVVLGYTDLSLARQHVAGLWPTDGERRDSNRSTARCARKPGARRGITGGRSAHRGVAHHGGLRRLDSRPWTAAAPGRYRRGATARHA